MGKMGKTVKICMTAIFKNESKNVYRCLNALKGIIDYVSICDTGSTDNTVELINKWGDDNSIPVKTHYEPFKNFGYNRSKSVELARKAFPGSNYFLLIDADMIVEHKNFEKSNLTKDCYTVKQKNWVQEYWNPRLLKASLPWECIGVTHEYWSSPKENNVSDQLTTIWIDDKEDGGCKSDKYERDKRLLLEAIEDKSTNNYLKIRYMFYLGQTYLCLKDYARSINWYTKRVEAGGWIEEIYHSLFQIGLCYEKMESFERAAGYYLEAWQKYPVRAEPLYSLAKMYRLQSKNNLAMLFALQGKEISYPKDAKLFIDYRVYEYLFDEEIVINAYYVEGKKPLGKKAVEKLYSMKNVLPNDTITMAKHNSKFYDFEWK